MWRVWDTRMITRALVLALWCAHTSALTPLSAAADDNECALYLSGPGRTSAFDYSLNLLRGNFGYEGQHTCITYEAVNQAYLDARKRILVAQPKGDWKPEDFASAGELILDISISLARTYGLTYEEIEKGLPLIDTSRTLIREVCPPVFSHVECRAGKYRRLDGLCNNLEHPTWGATNAPFQRLIGPLFSDGINSPRISHTGRDLPLSRVVSRTMHPDEGFHDHAGTVMVIAWGQFMDHDYTLTGTPLDPRNRNDPEECCKRPPHLKHPYCNEILIPDDDYFYRLFGVKCIDFVRAFPSPRPGCRLGSRVPFNTLTGAIDGNTVYGVTDKFARKLRTGYGGLLRMNPVFTEYGLKDLLPLKLDIPDEGCTRPNKNMYCFEAGEIRVNEQLVLTVMHTLMAREHNRVAKGLAEVNPHWDDETLYQEARRINIAEIQHITYNEFLPILLGKDVMEKFGLVLEKEGYWDGYDKTVNPDVIDSFASAAYRFGHSLLPTAVERWSKAHKFIASKRLSDLIRRPYDLYRAGVLDEYVMGLMNQVAQAMDDSITQEVTNHLFKKVGARFGMDLVSFNMQRGREFGIPGYMEFRKFCGLGGAESFEELHGSMPNETVNKYGQIFEHPVDIDLWSGGVSERPLPGSMLGPTFACIIATQFSYSRRGDRFWFELPNQPSSFTPEQLTEIRKSRLARVICDNTDIIDTVQLYPMVLADHELNPRVPCRSGIMPSMDFTKWAEPAPSPFHGAAKQFNVTDAIIKADSNITSNGNETVEDKSEEIVRESAELAQKHDQLKPIILNATLCNNDENKTTSECINNTIQAAHNTSESTNELNDTKDKDAVMQYVSGKNDDVPLKTSGHIRNSLRRKKRSLNLVLDNIRSNSAPEILHYETRHGPREREPLLPIHKLTQNKIQSANLADFNIETLHEPAGNLEANKKESWRDNIQLSQKHQPPKDESDDSREKGDNLEERKPYNGERDDNLGERKSYNDERDDNSGERKPYISERDDNSGERKPYISERDDNSGEKKPYINERDDNSGERKPYINERDDNSGERKPYINERDDNSGERKPYINERGDNSGERKPYINERDDNSGERKPYIRERDDNSGEKQSYVNDASDESIETNNDAGRERTHDSHTRSPENSNESLESEDLKLPSKDVDRKENQESNESNEDSNRNSKHVAAHARNIDSEEVNDNSDERDSPQEKNSKISRNYDESNEENEKPKHEPKQLNFDASDKTAPKGIQDVDLGDFSYERIQVGKDGKVELAKDIYGKDDDSGEEKPLNDKIIIKETEPPQSEYIEKVNNDEIKPVIELNTESNSNEYSDENVDTDIKQPQKAQLNSDDAGVEDLSDAKENDSGEKSDKQIAQNNEQQNGNVKQQFERIPLNYKHDKKTENTENNKKENETPTDDSQNEKDGTLDTLIPKEERYDEKLNFKFDDVSIKLPDIKLPEDILSYNYESSPYKKRNKKKRKNKNRFYHYSDEHSDEFPKEISIPQYDDDDDRGYYKYDDPYEKKQDYKKKPAQDDDEDDEGVDLYEKFVRERFGKRGSFEKRSEALRNEVFRPSDPKLSETIQHILKKSAANLKQAEKSGDPKAGYMWTLEYGQNL